MKRANGRGLNRRQLLKTAASAGGAVAAPFFVRSAALGEEGSAAPSERITLGLIGIGRVGRGHLRVFLEQPDVQIVAVCEVDRWRRENAKSQVEQTYAAAAKSGQYRGCAAYNDLRELLARDDIDAVLIAIGDRWHAAASVLAAQAGKDIYCEKPLSLTIREARVMADVARRYERVFQTGLQQRSTPEFQKACELVLQGRLGKLKIVYVNFPGTNENVNLPPEPVPEGLDWDLWLGPAPWRPFNSRFHEYGHSMRVVPWHFCRDFGGQNLTSNAVHNLDVVQWGLGMDDSGPVEIIPPETGKVPSLTYKYGNGVLVQVDWKLDKEKHFVPEGWNVDTKIENFGAVFVGEGGWIHVGRQGYLRSYPEEIVADWAGRPENTRPIPYHHRNWLDCIRTRQRPACDVAIGARSTMVSHLGGIAHWTGRALKWDPVKEEFIGDEEANRLRSRAMRQPWRI